MRLLKRIRFALKYDFDSEFIVWSYKDQNAVLFLDYKDAAKFSEEQIQYRPKVMVAVRSTHPKERGL